MVAPTEAISRYTEVPTSLSARATIFPLETLTFAPNASNPLVCKLIGLAPKLHPPGIPT